MVVWLSLALAVAQAEPKPEPAADVTTTESTETDSESGFSLQLAADGFYMVDWNTPVVPNATAALPHRAFDFTNGFALAFGAIDIAYSSEKLGATLEFRFGEGANRLIGNTDPVFSVLKQAYATWKPLPCLTLDLGQFDTIYGAEVANSWDNLNYTRGALYYLMQPFYHTGLRAGWAPSDMLSITLLVVNGTNNPIDSGQTPHVGLQAGLSFGDPLNLVVGWYGGAASSGFGAASNADEGDFENFFDLVITSTLGPVSLVGNVDVYLGGDRSGNPLYYGFSLAAGMPIVDTFAVALRGEYLGDPDLFISGAYESLVTGTLTFDYTPLDLLVIRLDNRIEVASDPVFPADGSPKDIWFASTLGVVVHASI
jgi:hypothetical protein